MASDGALPGGERQRLAPACAALLAELQQDTPGVLSATLATADGLAVASTLAAAHEADRLAAMSGSIAGLAAAMTAETGHGEPGALVLQSTAGHIVSLKVAGRGADLVLTVVSDTHALLGKLLWACRATAERISATARGGAPLPSSAGNGATGS